MFHCRAPPPQSLHASSTSNQQVPARVRAHAVSITPLVVQHRSLTCDKKVVTGNARGHLLLRFLPIDNLHFGRALSVIFPMAKLPTTRTRKSLFELVEPCLAIFR